jgi:hypothetical protein
VFVAWQTQDWTGNLQAHSARFLGRRLFRRDCRLGRGLRCRLLSVFLVVVLRRLLLRGLGDGHGEGWMVGLPERRGKRPARGMGDRRRRPSL